IEDILNHLDKLSLDHIEEIEGHVDCQVIIQQDFDKLKTKLQEACAPIAELQRKKMRHNNKISLARFRISTLQLIIEDIQRNARWVCATNAHGRLGEMYGTVLVGAGVRKGSLGTKGAQGIFGRKFSCRVVRARAVLVLESYLCRIDMIGPLTFNFGIFVELTLIFGQERMASKRTSTSAAPAMTHAAIRQLVADSVTAALKAQAANMANTDNTYRNTRPRETPAARKCTYKEFMSCQPFYFNGTE
nr:hypothetical protein [Tanacetum cinerariifolium]